MIKNNNQDTKILLSRAQDNAEMALKKGEPCFMPFLSDFEQAFVTRYAAYSRDDEKLLFFGGYKESDYKCAGFFPRYLFYDEDYDPYADFPVCTVLAEGSGFRRLTHRDFLGAIMSLGIKREMIGDIVVAEDGFSAYIFCLKKAADYLVDNFKAAANDKISCRLYANEDITIPEKKYEVINATVSSPRLDAVLCACINVSREEAGKMILSGLVSADHIVAEDKSKICGEGSVISVRGYGKFVINKIGDRNRRDRLRISIYRYV